VLKLWLKIDDLMKFWKLATMQILRQFGSEIQFVHEKLIETNFL